MTSSPSTRPTRRSSRSADTIARLSRAWREAVPTLTVKEADEAAHLLLDIIDLLKRIPQ